MNLHSRKLPISRPDNAGRVVRAFAVPQRYGLTQAGIIPLTVE